MKKCYLFVLILFALSYVDIQAANSSLPPPYDTVELLPAYMQGWYGNAPSIERLFAQKKPEIVIEVGSWLGVSTIHMASLLSPGSVVYAVDHWLGSVEHQPGQPFWSPVLPKLYEQFLSNVIHAKMTDKIIPIRMSSLEASQQLAGIQADIVYIDASHDYESVYADLNAWYPFIQDHGVLCGDDWHHRPIQQAVFQFANEQGFKVGAEGAFWYLY